jgi:DNA (cytosine-5)-methyltransferase 1
VGDAPKQRRENRIAILGQHDGQEPVDGRQPCNGFWRDAIWLPCIDGKARPTQSGIFPLVDGTSSRVGRLRAYGNAIVAPQAAEFVKAYMECRP